MYDKLYTSNATGSFQNQCSVASQMDPSPDEPSSSGTRAKRPIRKQDMTALLAKVALPLPINQGVNEGSKTKALAERFSSVEHETFNEIFALLIQGVIDVIKKQMDDYLGGELATLSPIKICSSAQYVCRANTWFG